MREESVFSKEEIIKKVLELYDIKINKIERINKGTANIFKLYSNENNYILKEFQSKYNEENVKKEIMAIEYLKKNSKIPLPNYIRSINGNYHFLHNEKVVVLQEFIDGIVHNKNEGDYEELIESAHYLGEIIKHLEGININDSVNIKDWYSNEEINKANKKYDKILEETKYSKIDNKIREDILFKKELLKDIKEKIDYNEINKITHKVSHGDYSSLQFIYNDNKKIKAIIDFIKVKRLPIVWEIARSYSYIDKKAINGNIDVKNLVDYTKEVSKSITLNKYDLKYLPYVYLIQLARSTFGYEEYYMDVKNKEELLEFAFYRTNICRELYEKSEVISKELLK